MVSDWVKTENAKLATYCAVSFFGTFVSVGSQLVPDRMSWWEWALFAGGLALSVATTFKAFTSGQTPDATPPVPKP